MIDQQTWSLLHTCKEFRLGTSPEIRLFQKKSQVIPLDDQKKEGHGKKTGKTRETAHQDVPCFCCKSNPRTCWIFGSHPPPPLLLEGSPKRNSYQINWVHILYFWIPGFLGLQKKWTENES